MPLQEWLLNTNDSLCTPYIEYLDNIQSFADLKIEGKSWSDAIATTIDEVRMPNPKSRIKVNILERYWLPNELDAIKDEPTKDDLFNYLESLARMATRVIVPEAGEYWTEDYWIYQDWMNRLVREVEMERMLKTEVDWSIKRETFTRDELKRLWVANP